MRIRNKILISFSSTVILLIGITFLVINIIYSENREEEFQQRQKQKISNTLFFLSEIKKTDNELIEAIDRLTINDLFDEKLLLFNEKKELIYSSVDDTPVPISKEMLSELNAKNQWIEAKDGLYDVVGTYLKKDGKTYYGISKAYDTFGYDKLYFLRNTLLTAFFIITASVLLVSTFLARRISKPLADLANHVASYRLGNNQLPKNIKTTTSEIIYLNEKFNELVKRTHESFAFQKNSIHHISHQLKTPIAVLISELERIENSPDAEKIKPELETQIIKTKSLADIINVLLEISKVESGQTINRGSVRIDEIIFDTIEEINTLYADFNFEVNYFPEEPDPNRLILNVNEMLIRQAFQNLFNNCIAYSSNSKAEIKIDTTSDRELKILISNAGKPVSKEEEKYLFNHFFRGDNSWDKMGFGLGLVLAQKIISLNSGEITYSNPSTDLIVFEVRFPLS